MAPSSPFIHGTTYYHYANGPEQLERNFNIMRQMGLNAVRVAEIWPGWEVLEPEPGRYDFDLLDDYVAKAARAGLAVVMGIGINNPPFWIFDEIPDLRTIDASGRLADRRIHAANHDEPRFRRHMEAFIDAHAAHYANAEAVMAWQFGNEIRYGVDLPDNPATCQRFRQWLQEQFESDLDRLNRLWATGYQHWGQVFPYKSRFGAPTAGLAPLALATRKFKAWSLAELVEWGVGILRRHSALPVFHNNHSLPGDTYSHWDIAALGDVVVQDIYPTMGNQPQSDTTVFLDVAGSIARTLGKDLWIGETGVGQYGTFRRNRPPRRQVEAGIVEMLASGAQALLYFRHKPPRTEQPHKFTGSQSALRPDGSELPYALSIRHATKLLEALGDRLTAAQSVRPRVAVYYPEESLLLARDAGYRRIQTDAVAGASALFNRLGIPIQYFNANWLIEEDLSDYQLLYVPVSFQMDAAVGRRLASFAAAGGTVCCEARCAYVDDQGYVYQDQPGAGLVELGGAREDLYWESPGMDVTVGLGQRTHSCRFDGPAQSYRLWGGNMLAHNERGEVLAVHNRAGAGQAFLLGFSPALAVHRQDESEPLSPEAARNRAAVLGLVSDLATEAGIARPVAIETGATQLSFRYLRDPDGSILVFCSNYGPDAAIELPDGSALLARNQGDSLEIEPRLDGPLSLGRYDWMLAACPVG